MMTDHGFPDYLSAAHREQCEAWDRRLAGDLPDAYLATFLAHFEAGKAWQDLPNPLICPRPEAIVAEVERRGWSVHREAMTVIVKPPPTVTVLDPIPQTLPATARRHGRAS